MRILVLNIPNTLNYGSMMMAENLLYYLSREMTSEDLEFMIATPKPEETIQRLKEAINVNGMQIRITAVSPRLIETKSVSTKLLSTITGIGLMNKLSKEAHSANAVIVLGGDDFTEDYGPLETIRSLLELRAYLKTEKKVLLCGQTIGPFSPWRKHIVGWLLKDITKITARDPVTYKYLRGEFGLKNVNLFADLAFLPLAREADSTRIGADGQYVTIVPSELIWKYTLKPNRANYISFLTGVCLELLKKFPDHKLRILPHVLAPDINDDRLAARDLCIALKRIGVMDDRLIYIDNPLLPVEARNIIRDSSCVVTGRMHAAISAISCGVPFLAFAYSRKYWGIIGEYLGLSDLLVDVRNCDLHELESSTHQALDRIRNNLAGLRESILNKAPDMRSKALENISLFAAILANEDCTLARRSIKD